MTNKIYLVLALCLVTFSIKIKHEVETHNEGTGRWTPIDIKNLTKDQIAVDMFIRGSEKDYQEAGLIGGETQVANGINYRYIYDV